jgi:histidine triad (HIT) family protein
MEKECTFCDVMHGKVVIFRVYEDKEHLAFLDIYPTTRGQTLVVTKEHIPSDFLNMSNESLLH